FDTPVVIDVAQNDSDIDGNLNPASVKLIDPVTGKEVVRVDVTDEGTWSVNPKGEVTFTPESGFSGAPTPIDYVISDSAGVQSAPAQISVIVKPNDAPIATNDSKEIVEDSIANGNVLSNDTDPENDPLSVKEAQVDIDGDGDLDAIVLGDATTITDNTGKPIGEFTINANGDYTFVSAENFTGEVPSIRYVAQDDKGGEDPSELKITVTPVEDAPITTDDDAQTPYNTPVTIDVLSNDSDPEDNIEPSSVKLIDPTNAGTLVDEVVVANEGTWKVNADGSITFTPEANFSGTPTPVDYVVSDKAGEVSQPASINVTVGAPANSAPTAENNSTVTEQDTAVSGNVISDADPTDGTDSDPENDPLTVSQFSVAGVNYQAGETASLTEGELSIKADGSYTFTPAAGFAGEVAPVTYTISDGSLSDTATLTITVDGHPDAVDDAISTPEGDAVVIDVLTNDNHPEGDTLIITDASVPAAQGSVVINSDGTLTFTPVTGFTGDASITYTIKDSNGDTDSATVIAHVVANKPPVATNDQGSGEEDSGIAVTGNVLDNDSDPEGETISVTQFTTADGITHIAGETATIAEGKITINADGSYRFVAAENYHGDVPSIHYTIVDEIGLTATAELNIKITPVADAPIADDNMIELDEGTSTALGLLAPIDPDTAADQLSITVTQLPILGSISKADGTIVQVGDVLSSDELTHLNYTAPDQYNGTDAIGKFTYDVKDDTGLVDEGHVIIKVAAVEDAPIVSISDVTVAEGEDATVTVSLDHASSVPTVIDITTVTGTAEAGDFTAVTTSVTIPAGEVSKEVTIATIDDAIFENTEQFTVKGVVTSGVTSNTEATGTVTIEDNEPAISNDPKIQSITSVTLSEEVLSTSDTPPAPFDGIQESDDTLDVRTATGKISFTDADTPASALSIVLGLDNGSYTSNGHAITWNWDSTTRTLKGSITDADGNRDIASIKIDGVSGTAGSYEATYTATLLGPIDHLAAGEDSLLLNFKATINDGGMNPAEHTFTVTVEDDVPQAQSGEQEVIIPATQTNLMFTLDVSNTMNRKQGGKTRLAVLQESVIKVIEDYSAFGPVKIQLIEFSSGAYIEGIWVNASTAINKINAMFANGLTNYEAAIQTTVDTFNANKSSMLTGLNTKTVSYFISDGNPTSAVSESTIGLWKQMMIDNHIKSYAIGMEEIGNPKFTEVGGDATPILHQLAIDASGNTVIDTDEDAYIVSSKNDIKPILNDSVKSIPVKSNLIKGNLDADNFGIGADGGAITSIEIDGDVYSYNKDNNTVTQVADATVGSYTFNPEDEVINITTDHDGQMSLNFLTGDYSYIPNTNNNSYTEVVTYTVEDNDGDVSANNTITLEITHASTSGRLFRSAVNSEDSSDTSENGSDDILLFDFSAPQVDAGAGEDTLVINNFDSLLNFNDLSNDINNVEVIDITDSKAESIVLSASDVVNMTDESNTLFVNGDAATETKTNQADKVNLSGFTQNAVSDQSGYDLYQDGTGIKLYIDTDIDTII
uniref:Ig-like domain-containing protein n=1 Tax=Psychrobacter sp. I-STPA10 TaxID=2585769 RepID=UPI001E59CB48